MQQNTHQQKKSVTNIHFQIFTEANAISFSVDFYRAASNALLQQPFSDMALANYMPNIIKSKWNEKKKKN